MPSHLATTNSYAGDRLDVEPGTERSATVGPDRVRCIEAGRTGQRAR